MKISLKIAVAGLLALCAACHTAPGQETAGAAGPAMRKGGLKTAGQEFLFLNIAPYSPGKERELAQDMIEYRKRTGNDFVLYSLSLHPDGFPARERAMRMIESYCMLKKELAGTPAGTETRKGGAAGVRRMLESG